MFFGYNSETEMRRYIGDIKANYLVSVATSRQIRVCAPPQGTECWGSMDGVYMYSDGSRNKGRSITDYRAEVKSRGFVFAWSADEKA